MEMQQIEMIRKHKSEDNIDIEVPKPQENWCKSDAEGNIVVVINDHVEPYISPALLR
jgi:hypothetical protein